MWVLISIVGGANEWDAATITSDFCHRVVLLQCSQGDMTPYVRIDMHVAFRLRLCKFVYRKLLSKVFRIYLLFKKLINKKYFLT